MASRVQLLAENGRHSALGGVPFTDGKTSWWPIVQVILRAGANLAVILGVRYIAYCMVQIIILGWFGNREVMVGWVNRWGVFRPTAMIHAAV